MTEPANINGANGPSHLGLGTSERQAESISWPRNTQRGLAGPRAFQTRSLSRPQPAMPRTRQEARRAAQALFAENSPENPTENALDKPGRPHTLEGCSVLEEDGLSSGALHANEDNVRRPFAATLRLNFEAKGTTQRPRSKADSDEGGQVPEAWVARGQMPAVGAVSSAARAQGPRRPSRARHEANDERQCRVTKAVRRHLSTTAKASRRFTFFEVSPPNSGADAAEKSGSKPLSLMLVGRDILNGAKVQPQVVTFCVQKSHLKRENPLVQELADLGLATCRLIVETPAHACQKIDERLGKLGWL